MLATSGTRRITPASESVESRPWPGAARSSSSRLFITPAYWRRLSCGSPPRTRNGAARSTRPVASGMPAMPSTTGAPESALANTASLLGSAAMRADSSASASCRCSTMRAGDMRSGSGISTSMPIAAGPALLIASIRFASTVRGQGHWPSSVRLFSSIATTTAGIDLILRGSVLW